VAPHPDDETLGCGGTIIKKKRAGADVKLLFMTDGRHSHRSLIGEAELKRIRRGEALAAGRRLGVADGSIVFFDYEDETLALHLESAAGRIGELLERDAPEEIFVPYRFESPADHRATHRAVEMALRTHPREVVVYEYPIWFWYHSLRTPAPVRSPRKLVSAAARRFLAGLRRARDLRCSIGIADLLDEKREALNEYRSQMTRLDGNPEWPTLGDVADGEFLNCFFRGEEVFLRYTHRPHGVPRR